MIINNPKYNSLPEQVEENRKDIKEIKERILLDVDDELSTQSTNAVQNKVITEALQTEEFERKQDVEDLENADETLQNQINDKVGKTNTINQVYATDSDGEQTTIEYKSSLNNSQNKIVQRDNNGDVLVPDTPTSNNGATPKSYVDILLNGKISKVTQLWNSSQIGYGFDAQTITINNASAYSYLIVEFREFSQKEARYVQIFKNYNNVTNTINFSEVDTNNSRFVARSRAFTKTSDTSISWGDGLTWYSNTGVDSNKKYIEPIVIYGINLED